MSRIKSVAYFGICMAGAIVGTQVVLTISNQRGSGASSESLALSWRLHVQQFLIGDPNADQELLKWMITDVDRYLAIQENNTLETLEVAYAHWLAGNSYGITGSSERALVEHRIALQSFQWLHQQQGIDDAQDAYQVAALLWQMGVHFEQQGFILDASKSHALSMDIAAARLANQTHPPLLSMFGRSYDAWVHVNFNLSSANQDLMSTESRLQNSIDLWRAVAFRPPIKRGNRYALATCHTNYARFLFKTGRLSKASEQYELACEAIGDRPNTQSVRELDMAGQVHALGMCLYQQLGDEACLDQARQSFEEVVESLQREHSFSPRDRTNALAHIATMLHELGDSEGAARLTSESEREIDCSLQPDEHRG